MDAYVEEIRKLENKFAGLEIHHVDCDNNVGADALSKLGVGVYCQACSGIPLAVRFVGRDRRLWNSMVQGTQRFRQVRAASCVIPYVLCVGLYCLRC